MVINDGNVYGKMNGGIASEAETSANPGLTKINGGNFTVDGSMSYYVLVSQTSTNSVFEITGGTFVKNGGNGNILGGFDGMPSWDASENLKQNGYTISGGIFIKDGEQVNFSEQV